MKYTLRKCVCPDNEEELLTSRLMDCKQVVTIKRNKALVKQNID